MSSSASASALASSGAASSGAPLVIRKVLSQEQSDNQSNSASNLDLEPRILHRWRIRKTSQRILCAAIPKAEWPRVVRCGWSLGSLVTLMGQSGRTGWCGIEHCNSLWACPLCSARIREGRRREILEGFEQAQALGWAAFFVTFTVPHSRETPLTKSLGALRGAYARMRRYSSLRDFWGSVEGVIKATEVQVGNHGFHPHLHCIFFTKNDSLDEATLKSAWAKAVVKEGLARPSERVGVVVKEATTANLSWYLTKIQESKLSFEMTRSDLKKGRGKSEWHCAPFDLLDSSVSLPISMAQRQRLWVDYVTATKGVSAIRWSKNLKSTLSIGEVSDEDCGALDPLYVEARLNFLRREYARLFKDNPELLAQAQQLFAEQRYQDVLDLGIGSLILEPSSDDLDRNDDEPDWGL